MSKQSAADSPKGSLKLSSFSDLRELIANTGVRLLALDVRGTLLAVPREGNLTRSLAGLVPSSYLEEVEAAIPKVVLDRYRYNVSVRDWTMVTLLECCSILRQRGIELDAASIELAFQRLADEYRLQSVPLVADERLALAIKELRMDGVRTVIAADGPQVREQSTIQLHLPLAFAELHDIFSSEVAGVNKLASAFYECLLHREDLNPSQLLVIGDRVDKDIAPARALGAHGLLVRQPSEDICWWSDGLSELLPSPYGVVLQGAVLGRFQPFHIEHLRYIMAAARRTQRLIIGITHPYGSEISEPGTTRTTGEANPLPLWLRRDIIRASLGATGLDEGTDIIAVPLNPKTLRASLPPEATVFTTAVEPWSEVKERTIRASGLRVERLEVGTKTVSSTMVRKAIRSGDRDWRLWMPSGIPEHLLLEIEQRVLCCPDND